MSHRVNRYQCRRDIVKYRCIEECNNTLTGHGHYPEITPVMDAHQQLFFVRQGTVSARQLVPA